MGTGGMMDGKVNKLFLNWGQAIVFCSSFCHAGDSNYIIDKIVCKYCLFVNIVLEEADYTSEVGTRVQL
jgi:hypothetical protein